VLNKGRKKRCDNKKGDAKEPAAFTLAGAAKFGARAHVNKV